MLLMIQLKRRTVLRYTSNALPNLKLESIRKNRELLSYYIIH